MDSEAINTIQGIVAAGLRLPQSDQPVVLCPPGSDLRGIEDHQDAPYRMRSRFTTERIADFVQYVNVNKGDGTAVFVDPQGGGATAVIDYGDQDEPMWGEHRAILKMRHTPEFEALKAASGKRLSQRDIIDWLEDWPHCVRPYRDGEEISVAEAIQILRRVDINAARDQTFEEEDFKGSRSALEQIEAKAGAGSLPGRFMVLAPVYVQTDERSIVARLSLSVSGDEPAFKLRIMGEDSLMQDVAEEIETKLTERLDETRVFIGGV